MDTMKFRRFLFYAGVWGVIFIGFYFGFWHPSIGRLKKIQNQSIMHQRVIGQLTRDIETYPDTITAENLDNVEDNLRQLLARIPAKEEVHTILKQIQAYGTQTALDITRVAHVPQEETEETSVVTQTFSIPKMRYEIRAAGSARNVMRFLHKLENGVWLIAIEAFIIYRLSEDPFALNPSSSEDTHSVNANITLNIFYTNTSTQ